MKFNSDVFGGWKKKEDSLKVFLKLYIKMFLVLKYNLSIEEKAANLLYFLIKDYPFADGCKRIGASLFL